MLFPFLDSKLHGRRLNKSLIPSYILDDPDFAVENGALAPEAQDKAEAELAEGDAVSSGASVTLSQYSLGSHTTPYRPRDFPTSVKELDRQLLNILKMNVKGTN